MAEDEQLPAEAPADAVVDQAPSDPTPAPEPPVVEAPADAVLLQGTPVPADIPARKPKCPYCGARLTADPSTSPLFSSTAFCDRCGVRHRLVD